MKCEDCCHAEMCKWIDELGGRGCDFLSQKQIFLNDINNALEASFRNGVRSAKVEQEPCDDAISREAVIDALQYAWEANKDIQESIVEIKALPSVTQKSGKWILQPSNKEQGERDFIWWKCSECGHVIYSETEKDRREYHAFCGRCGAKMFEPQESEDLGDYPDTIHNQFDNMTGSMNL